MADDFIATNVPEVVDSLERFKREQIPFATALALTMTAGDAREAIVRDLPSRFTIRRKWIERGIRTTRATKRNLEATVFSRDPFMLKQQQGGKKQDVSIPFKVRRSERTVASRSRWPGKLLGRADVFIRDLPSGSGRRGVFQRMRSGRLKLLWILEDVAETKPRWEFEEQARKSVRRNWEKNFGKAFARAIATAR